MERIYFNSNFNEKLLCYCFTTIRLSNHFKYIIGNSYMICENWSKNKRELFTATLVGSRSFWLNDLNDAMSYIDTGYNAEDTKKMIALMYKDKNIDFNKKLMVHLIFKRGKMNNDTEMFLKYGKLQYCCPAYKKIKNNWVKNVQLENNFNVLSEDK